MFVRPAWRPRSDEDVWQLVNDYPWAILVTNGSDGPYATNLPLLLDTLGGKRALVGHIARGNAHAQALASATSPTLAIFQGPYSYVTSSWYPNRDMPPTYYYTAVHCYGQVTMQDEETLRSWLETLTNRYENPIPDGWRTSEIEPSAITRRLKSIVGFELHIERVEAKFKLGQDEPKSDALAVANRLTNGDRMDSKLAKMVWSYNADREENSIT